MTVYIKGLTNLRSQSIVRRGSRDGPMHTEAELSSTDEQKQKMVSPFFSSTWSPLLGFVSRTITSSCKKRINEAGRKIFKILLLIFNQRAIDII